MFLLELPGWRTRPAPSPSSSPFAPLLSLTAALAAALLPGNALAVQLLAVAALLNTDAINRTGPETAAYWDIVLALRHDLRSLLLATGRCLLVLGAVVAGSTIKNAAVAAFPTASGGVRRSTRGVVAGSTTRALAGGAQERPRSGRGGVGGVGAH